MESLEDLDEFPIAAGDLGHRGFPCHLLRAPIDKRLPEARASDGEANEARHSSRGCQPFANLLIVLTPTQNDTTDSCAAVPTRSGNNPFAVLMPVKSFNLPYVRLDACVLELLDGLRHQERAKFQVIGLLVSFQVIELGWLSWYEQSNMKRLWQLLPCRYSDRRFKRADCRRLRLRSPSGL